jgi:hypothetical protein
VVWCPTDNTKNACHGSDAAETAAHEAAFFFGDHQQLQCAQCANTVPRLCVPRRFVHIGASGATCASTLSFVTVTAPSHTMLALQVLGPRLVCCRCRETPT